MVHGELLPIGFKGNIEVLPLCGDHVNSKKADLLLSSCFSFGIGLWIKKEWIIPQMPSIRERSHSYLGGTTTYNGKRTITPFLNQSQGKNATLWQIFRKGGIHFVGLNDKS